MLQATVMATTPKATRLGRWGSVLITGVLLATACAAPSRPPTPRDPASDEAIWPAGPPPTPPGSAGDVPDIPPPVKP
jgi:hypothetical protein